jgi:hypothetical protein
MLVVCSVLVADRLLLSLVNHCLLVLCPAGCAGADAVHMGAMLQ